MQRCQGTNKDGSGCRNRVLEGEQYCYAHRGQAPPSNGASQTWEIIFQELVPRESRLLIGLILLAAFLGAVVGSCGAFVVGEMLDLRRMTVEVKPEPTRVGLKVAREATLTAVRALPPAVGSLGEEMLTDEWAVTVSEVKRAQWLPWHGRRLEPDGQWIILYGRARNPTTQPVPLFSRDFALAVPSLRGEIIVHRDATGAAGLESGVGRTVAGFLGLTIKPGGTAPLVLAFDVPDVAERATLQLVGTTVSVDLGSVRQAPMLPTPVPTATRTPTSATWTPTSTNTPIPTDTPSPTNTPEPTITPTPTTKPKPTSTPTPSPELSAVVVAARGLIVRAGPGSDYQRLGGVAQGTELVLSARNVSATWVRGRAPEVGLEGWFLTVFVEIDGDVMRLPVAETGP